MRKWSAILFLTAGLAAACGGSAMPASSSAGPATGGGSSSSAQSSGASTSSSGGSGAAGSAGTGTSTQNSSGGASGSAASSAGSGSTTSTGTGSATSTPSGTSSGTPSGTSSGRASASGSSAGTGGRTGGSSGSTTGSPSIHCRACLLDGGRCDLYAPQNCGSWGSSAQACDPLVFAAGTSAPAFANGCPPGYLCAAHQTASNAVAYGCELDCRQAADFCPSGESCIFAAVDAGVDSAGGPLVAAVANACVAGCDGGSACASGHCSAADNFKSPELGILGALLLDGGALTYGNPPGLAICAECQAPGDCPNPLAGCNSFAGVCGGCYSDSDCPAPLGCHHEVPGPGHCACDPSAGASSGCQGIAPHCLAGLNQCGCGADSDCPAAAPVCDVTATPPICKARCETGSCESGGKFCDTDGGLCLACGADGYGQCASGYACSSGSCIGACSAGGCESTGRFCDTSVGLCATCGADGYGQCATGYTCASGTCIGPCTVGSCERSGRFCDPGVGVCYACGADGYGQCAAGFTCAASVCIPACVPGSCAGATPFCETDGGICLGCLVDSNCTAAGALCLSNTCVVPQPVGGPCASDPGCQSPLRCGQFATNNDSQTQRTLCYDPLNCIPFYDPCTVGKDYQCCPPSAGSVYSTATCAEFCGAGQCRAY